eukprot:TRINITY_DN47026_c0_g1_i1.p1 TRINITY_DN47026_c0_g1~~TRINITY_DN47026_c0_g1_i1.p1  ORF type:complete len:821 (+),score=83.61 TRINITY_DN47026_c0_g1_i1:80-2542(+)
MEDGAEAVLQGYASMHDTADGTLVMPQSNRDFAPEWTRAEDNKLRMLAAKHEKSGDSGMDTGELAELRCLEARSSRFIAQGLKDLDASPRKEDRQLQGLGIAARRLGWDLVCRGIGGDGGNSTALPLHTMSLLILAAEGAQGDALQELKARCGALRLGGLKQAGRLVLEVLRASKRAEGVVDSVALWLRQGLRPTDRFTEAAGKWGCAFESLVSESTLNAWVQKNSGFRESIADNCVVFTASAVLTSGLLLDCQWHQPFPSELSTTQQFRTRASGGWRNAPCTLMHTRGAYDYAECAGKYSAIRMPFAGTSGLEAVVVLPLDPSEAAQDARQSPSAGRARGASFLSRSEPASSAASSADTLTDLIQMLSAGSGWDALLARFKRHEGEVWLPKFTCAPPSGLRANLSEVGCPTPFGPGADFSHLCGTGAVYLENMHCLARVLVRERGVVSSEEGGGGDCAASSTAGPGARRFQMRCDRPFLFVVQHVESLAPVLACAVTCPDAPPSGSHLFPFTATSPQQGDSKFGSSVRRLSSVLRSRRDSVKAAATQGVHNAFFGESAPSTPTQEPALMSAGSLQGKSPSQCASMDSHSASARASPSSSLGGTLSGNRARARSRKKPGRSQAISPEVSASPSPVEMSPGDTPVVRPSDSPLVPIPETDPAGAFSFVCTSPPPQYIAPAAAAAAPAASAFAFTLNESSQPEQAAVSTAPVTSSTTALPEVDLLSFLASPPAAAQAPQESQAQLVEQRRKDALKENLKQQAALQAQMSELQGQLHALQQEQKLLESNVDGPPPIPAVGEDTAGRSDDDAFSHLWGTVNARR